MIIMTPEDRDFNRLARLAIHNLEIFRHLQEMCFEDPRMVLDALTNLIDQTVRLSMPSSQVITNYDCRQLSLSCLDLIQSFTFFSRRPTLTSANIFSKTQLLRLPTAGTS
jgi:hypothetical protein